MFSHIPKDPSMPRDPSKRPEIDRDNPQREPRVPPWNPDDEPENQPEVDPTKKRREPDPRNPRK